MRIPIVVGELNDGSGRYVGIDEVKRGKACNVICIDPNCRGELVARHGMKNRHSFSHAKGEACKCTSLGMTQLHATANMALGELGSIVVPNPKTFFNEPYGITEIKVDESFMEKPKRDWKPDVTILSNNNELNIETKVTHGVDGKKLFKIIRDKANTIELDLTGIGKDTIVDVDYIKNILSNETDRISWIFNANVYETNKLIFKNSEIKVVTDLAKEKSDVVMGCFMACRLDRNGKTFALFDKDCKHCPLNGCCNREYQNRKQQEDAIANDLKELEIEPNSFRTYRTTSELPIKNHCVCICKDMNITAQYLQDNGLWNEYIDRRWQGIKWLVEGRCPCCGRKTVIKTNFKNQNFIGCTGCKLEHIDGKLVKSGCQWTMQIEEYNAKQGIAVEFLKSDGKMSYHDLEISFKNAPRRKDD